MTNFMTVFVNADWFNISSQLLSESIIINDMEYSQCVSMLDSMSSTSSYYGVFACDISSQRTTGGKCKPFLCGTLARDFIRLHR